MTYAVPLFCLLVALVGIVIVLVVLIRRRKRKRVLNHLRSPDPVTSPVGVVFHKKNSELFSPVSLISPQSASAAFNDPLEFPRNKLYVYTRKVLGMCLWVYIISCIIILHGVQSVHCVVQSTLLAESIFMCCG